MNGEGSYLKTWIMLLYFYSIILFMLHFAVSVCLFLLIIGPVIILLNTEFQVNELVQLIPSLAVSNPLGGNFSKSSSSLTYLGHGNLQENQAKVLL